MINSSTNAGETIHVEYSWSNTNSNSPVDSDMATLGTSNNTFSFYNVQAGIRSQGVFPYSGVDFTIRANKVNFDDYNWGYPEDNFKYLSSNTLYANTPTDVAALLAASTTIPNVDVTNPSPNINLATVTGLSLPVGNQYLYVIYDLKGHWRTAAVLRFNFCACSLLYVYMELCFFLSEYCICRGHSVWHGYKLNVLPQQRVWFFTSVWKCCVHKFKLRGHNNGSGKCVTFRVL
jgi:hypothetical protein